MHVQESESEILQIKDLLEKIKYEIKLKLAIGYENPTDQYDVQQLKHLMKECNTMSKEAQ